MVDMITIVYAGLFPCLLTAAFFTIRFLGCSTLALKRIMNLLSGYPDPGKVILSDLFCNTINNYYYVGKSSADTVP